MSVDVDHEAPAAKTLSQARPSVSVLVAPIPSFPTWTSQTPASVWIADIAHNTSRYQYLSGSYNGDLVLSGGFSYHYCTRCTYGVITITLVFPPVFTVTEIILRPPSLTLPSGASLEILLIPARLPLNRNGRQWSNLILVLSPQGVLPPLLNSREAHSCLEFEGMFLVVGGYRHVYSHGPNGGEPHESFTYQSSGEYYDGEGWQQTESLVTARAHFSLEEMCGSLVSIGGQSAELEYLDTVERLWSVWNSWLPADYLRLPQPRAHAGSAAVSGLGNL